MSFYSTGFLRACNFKHFPGLKYIPIQFQIFVLYKKHKSRIRMQLKEF